MLPTLDDIDLEEILLPDSLPLSVSYKNWISVFDVSTDSLKLKHGDT